MGNKKGYHPKSEFKKGHIPWDKGIRRPEISGKNHPMYGKHHSKETIEKIQKTRNHPNIIKTQFKKGHKGYKAMLGKKQSLETIEKRRLKLIGHKTSEETKIKIGLANKGKIPWNKGLTKETMPDLEKKIYSKKRGKTYEEFYGEQKAKKIKERLIKNLREQYKIGRISPSLGKTKELSFHWKGGLPNCLICGEELSHYKGKLCRNCFLETFGGQNHPNWQGGLSFEPYDKSFNNKFKRAIRKRDNQICMLCKIHREKLSKALNVHHINYNKLMSIPQNCVSLCRNCHIQTNKNRKHWTKHFQLLLAKLYDYKYSENQEIILEVEK